LDDVERRIALAQGSPGLAVSLDLAAYDRRCAAMLTLLEVASGAAPFGAWVKYAESPESRQEKIEPLLRTLYSLLDDVLLLQQGAGGIRNSGLRDRLAALAGRVGFAWPWTRWFSNCGPVKRRDLPDIPVCFSPALAGYPALCYPYV
jgi:DNA polymerase-3 subunit delta'